MLMTCIYGSSPLTESTPGQIWSSDWSMIDAREKGCFFSLSEDGGSQSWRGTPGCVNLSIVWRAMSQSNAVRKSPMQVTQQVVGSRFGIAIEPFLGYRMLQKTSPGRLQMYQVLKDGYELIGERSGRRWEFPTNSTCRNVQGRWGSGLTHLSVRPFLSSRWEETFELCVCMPPAWTERKVCCSTLAVVLGGSSTLQSSAFQTLYPQHTLAVPEEERCRWAGWDSLRSVCVHSCGFLPKCHSKSGLTEPFAFEALSDQQLPLLHALRLVEVREPFFTGIQTFHFGCAATTPGIFCMMLLMGESPRLTGLCHFRVQCEVPLFYQASL